MIEVVSVLVAPFFFAPKIYSQVATKNKSNRSATSLAESEPLKIAVMKKHGVNKVTNASAKRIRAGILAIQIRSRNNECDLNDIMMSFKL